MIFFSDGNGAHALGAILPANHEPSTRVVACCSNGATREIRATLRLVQKDDGIDAPERTTRIHLATYGEFKGHPAGPFTFDRKAFETIKRNFDAQRTPVNLTYEHPHGTDGQPVPSAGKVLALDIDGEGLWATVRLTPRAAEMVATEEYSYCSVVVAFEYDNRVTAKDQGATLLQVGLTDSPFIDGQRPIRLAYYAAAA